jgi:hypothetical protein
MGSNQAPNIPRGYDKGNTSYWLELVSLLTAKSQYICMYALLLLRLENVSVMYTAR